MTDTNPSLHHPVPVEVKSLSEKDLGQAPVATSECMQSEQLPWTPRVTAM